MGSKEIRCELLFHRASPKPSFTLQSVIHVQAMQTAGLIKCVSLNRGKIDVYYVCTTSAVLRPLPLMSGVKIFVDLHLFRHHYRATS